jgi:hypothetical protein
MLKRYPSFAIYLTPLENKCVMSSLAGPLQYVFGWRFGKSDYAGLATIKPAHTLPS